MPPPAGGGSADEPPREVNRSPVIRPTTGRVGPRRSARSTPELFIPADPNHCGRRTVRPPEPVMVVRPTRRRMPVARRFPTRVDASSTGRRLTGHGERAWRTGGPRCREPHLPNVVDRPGEGALSI